MNGHARDQVSRGTNHCWDANTGRNLTDCSLLTLQRDIPTYSPFPMENASLHIFDILMFLKMLKMVSAKRSSNKMISAKIKLPKNTHSMVTF